MKHTEIWFGLMTHDSLNADDTPIVLIHSIEEKAIMNPADVEEYMTSQGHDSYLILDEFKGVIAYSTQFMKGLTP